MLKVFAIRDVKADSYGSLICLPTRGLALRALADSCSDPACPYTKYPADYSLYELGEYDPSTGVIEPVRAPVLVASVSAVVEQLKSAREVPVKRSEPEEAIL